MREKRRMIGDVSKELGLPKHTIRTLENEMKLNIPRDEKGYRYYGDREVKMIREIYDMRQHGMNPHEMKVALLKNVIPFPEKENEGKNMDKMEQFQSVMVKIVGRAIHQQKEEISREVGNEVVAQVSKELDYQFRIREELQEQRFKKIDELIRIQQKTREEIAAAKEKKHWFRKK